MEFNTVEELIQDLKFGKNIIILDNEDRENEGDVICAAEFASLENINFMATYARGLICMPMSKEYVERLKLEPMCKVNGDNHGTAFMEAIDHVDTKTGISAQERSYTAMHAVYDSWDMFRRPGHMFPLEAKEGGVLVRDGHTEATVDFCRLAGLKEIGLCCEIMKDDGTMARKEDLFAFAKKHGLKIGTVEDLKTYRKEHENLVERIVPAMVILPYMDI